MSRCHVRCKACDKRRVLKEKPECYFVWNKKLKHFINKAPACDGCGKNDYYISHWMNKRKSKHSNCSCKGYVHLTKRVWPHRIGSKYCWYRKDGSQRVEGDKDFHDSEYEEYIKESHHHEYS